jgi:hypothetical protein
MLIKNQGRSLVWTDYWLTDQATRGYFFLSWHAGAARLLVPDTAQSSLQEMRTGSIAIISRGPWTDQDGREAIEILFEDGSDAPFSCTLLAEQCDCLIGAEDQGGHIELVVYSSLGQELALPAKYRRVNSLPCLQPWQEH